MQAVTASATEADVAWTDNSSNEDEFSIQREEVAGGGAVTAEGAPARVYGLVGTVGASSEASALTPRYAAGNGTW